MSFNAVPLRHLAASFFAVILLSAAAAAQTSQQPDFSQVTIKNFGRMDDRFFRGAEPKTLEDFAALKALGIDTIIDL